MDYFVEITWPIHLAEMLDVFVDREKRVLLSHKIGYLWVIWFTLLMDYNFKANVVSDFNFSLSVSSI